VVAAIDRQRYRISLIGIDHAGHWHLFNEEGFRRLTQTHLTAVPQAGDEVVLAPAPSGGTLIDPVRPGTARSGLDVVFPVLHGTYGEDGTVQGLLDLADLPYVGAGVLGSAIGMDKDVQKRLLQAAGLPVVPFVTATGTEWLANREAVLAGAIGLGLPLFVKPANLGSSVGVSKVKGREQLAAGIEAALAYDNKIVIEKGLAIREIECAVLGNEAPQASIPGEICPRSEFYSYEAKYIDADGATLKIPAPLSPEQTAVAQDLAVRVFQVLECAGMARVDLFLDGTTGTFYVNEINTIPGFTTISMYPKMWEASGLSYTDLISRLIDLALQRHAQRRRLKRTYAPS